ncbi:MAG: FAD-dependent oxidoreductase [Caldilineaceae bacterium]
MERQCDILVVGAGLGGVAATLAAAQLGRRVILTEETDWIGGQLTAQAVPPDEHPWIETTGCTASYRRLRQGIRHYYWRNYPVTEAARHDMLFNPGQGNVSRLCHEPRVALAVLEELLAPYRARRQVELLLRHRPLAVECDGDHIRAVTLLNEENGDEVVITAPYILDATELGDLLELAEVEHLIGAEGQEQTGELHAVRGDPQPHDQQAITWCFAVDYLPGEDHTIAQPAHYAFWRDYQADFWPGKQLGWQDVDPQTLETRHRGIFFNALQTGQGRYVGDFWHYRRILYQGHYGPGLFPSDICLVNWPHNDYWLGPLLGVSEEEQQNNLNGAAQLSYALLYWMQTEAPRHDGGYGYPGLRLRGDVTGTSHGLAKSVYVRESRRLLAEFTVLEEHVGVEQRGALVGAERFTDSVGVGSYRIDLHPSTAPRTYIDISNWPFQIPLGALIPQRVENLLPACKNLGVTHITNGCYRLHPVEWNIGEAAGALAAYCLAKGLTPRQVRNTATHLADFQTLLVEQLGFVLEWPEYARITPR